jgi:predicted nucleic-acid-binding Zn-ribbon protein
MEEGFVLGALKAVSTWVEGAPEISIAGARLSRKRTIQMKTFRCLECGYPENYAYRAAASRLRLAARRTRRFLF